MKKKVYFTLKSNSDITEDSLPISGEDKDTFISKLINISRWLISKVSTMYPNVDNLSPKNKVWGVDNDGYPGWKDINFVGTREEMEAKLASGELKDGMSVYIDDVNKKGVISDAKVYFKESDERQNIISGDTLGIIVSNLSKWLKDLNQAATVVNNVDQQVAGKGVLDAAVGHYLDQKKIDASRVVESKMITELGFIMDGKVTADWIKEKQDSLAMGSNTIKDLDSLFVGCVWYNSEQVTAGTKPFPNYGYIIAFQSAGGSYVQIAIPYGGSRDKPRFRTRVNGVWQNWKYFSNFENTMHIPDSGTNCNSYTNSGMYFKSAFDAASDVNYPYQGAGWLEVFNFLAESGNIFYFQRYTVWGMTLVYTRFHNQNGWTPWKQVGGVVSEVYQVNTTYANSLKFSRIGGICFVRLDTPKNLKANDEVTITTLPEKYRPASYMVTVAKDEKAPLTDIEIRIMIETSGLFHIHNYSNNTGILNIGTTFSYPCV